MAHINKFDMHDFYCSETGKFVISLPRQHGHQYQSFHKKVMWCPYCKIEHNLIECKNYGDVIKFKEDYENGIYRNEPNSLDT